MMVHKDITTKRPSNIHCKILLQRRQRILNSTSLVQKMQKIVTQQKLHLTMIDFRVWEIISTELGNIKLPPPAPTFSTYTILNRLNTI